MTLDEIMWKLAELGSEQTKKTFINHGVQGTFFGVKVGDLKKASEVCEKGSRISASVI